MVHIPERFCAIGPSAIDIGPGMGMYVALRTNAIGPSTFGSSFGQRMVLDTRNEVD